MLKPKPQFFFLHFAGGNCYSFQFLQPYFSGMSFIPLELPGRGRRMEEPLLTDFHKAAEDIVRQVLVHLRSPDFVIYGHSMGAILALKVAAILEARNKPPLYIIVSGTAGPGVIDPIKRYLLEKDEFKRELKRLGGVPDQLLANDEVLDFFLPIIRADFEIAEREDFSSLPPVQIPIYAIMGDQEEDVDKIDSWRHFTRSHCSMEVLSGDHFFIHPHARRIAEIIKTGTL